MATDIYDDAGLVVTRKAGPADEGADRFRLQFTTPSDTGYVTLTRPQVVALRLALFCVLYPPPKPVVRQT